MPEIVTIDETTQFVEVISSGEIGTDDLNDSLDSVVQLCDRTGIHSVLCDTREQTSLPPIREYKAFIDKLPQHLAIAILVSDRSKTRDMQHAGEAMAMRSGVLYKLFYTKIIAVQWLSIVKNHL